MKVLKDFNNELIHRRELSFIIQSQSNPGFQKVYSIVSEHFKANIEIIVIKKIAGNFGSRDFLIDAYIYNSVEDKNRFEPKAKQKKESKDGAK